MLVPGEVKDLCFELHPRELNSISSTQNLQETVIKNAMLLEQTFSALGASEITRLRNLNDTP